MSKTRSVVQHGGRLGSLGDSLRALVQKSQVEQTALREAAARQTPVNAVSVGMMAHALSLPEADHDAVSTFEAEGCPNVFTD